MKIKKIDKKLYRLIFICCGIFLTLIVIILIGKLLIGTKLSYTRVEEKMKTAAISYYSVRKDELPKQDGQKISISTEKLIEAKNLKSLDKLIKDKNITCKGHVTIANNNGYLLYSPYLDCGKEYTTSTLVSEITDPSKIVEAGNGLYKIGNEYIFRGEYVNNYINFAQKTWRILRITEDNSIRIFQINKAEPVVWDNRYNIDTQSTDGINNYRISRLRDTINQKYNNNKIFQDVDKAYILSKDICIGKRNISDTSTDGSTECSDKLEKQPLGLMQINEYLIASIDPNCKSISSHSCINYNYLSKQQNTFWSITADADNTNKVFKISNTPFSTYANNESSPNLTLYLSGDITYVSGDGTIDNPYTFQ